MPSLNDLVVKVFALALREHPFANGAYRDGKFAFSRINVGIALAEYDGLLVPTVVDADAKGVVQIALESRELARRVREGAITPPELAGGTFTVSYPGDVRHRHLPGGDHPMQRSSPSTGERGAGDSWRRAGEPIDDGGQPQL